MQWCINRVAIYNCLEVRSSTVKSEMKVSRKRQQASSITRTCSILFTFSFMTKTNRMRGFFGIHNHKTNNNPNPNSFLFASKLTPRLNVVFLFKATFVRTRQVNESIGGDPSLEVRLEPLWRRSTLVDLAKAGGGIEGFAGKMFEVEKPQRWGRSLWSSFFVGDDLGWYHGTQILPAMLPAQIST